jgi:hypothetical protein
MGLGIPMTNSANVSSFKESEYKFLYVCGHPTYEGGYEINPDAVLYNTPEEVAQSVHEVSRDFKLREDGVWISSNATCIIRLKCKVTL